MIPGQEPSMIPNYEVTQNLLWNDWQTLARGRRITDQKPVLLKMSRRGTQAIGDDELLEREFHLLRELSIAGVPRALELIRSDNGVCLVIEDGGGVPLSEPPARRLDLDSFFRLAIRLTQILAELHRHDVVHRNISPRSIWLNPATGEVWLADLSLGARAAGEIQEPIPTHLLRYTLAYASPEQTGRMNRATDYRTDFYSLGVTFYELLTGRLPFDSTDALELIHWHIAKTPLPPSEVDPKIPEPLSGIVMKLLAKTAEDRYQSAFGLRADLEVCAREWAAH
jgi:serine/threonine protein kinase